MNIQTEAEMVVIDRVRLLTGLSENEVTDELILAIPGTPEQRAGKIILYREGLTEK